MLDSLDACGCCAPLRPSGLCALPKQVCRPECVHEYVLTPHSLYAAVSIGLDTAKISTVLNRLSKAGPVLLSFSCMWAGLRALTCLALEGHQWHTKWPSQHLYQACLRFVPQAENVFLAVDCRDSCTCAAPNVFQTIVLQQCGLPQQIACTNSAALGWHAEHCLKKLIWQWNAQVELPDEIRTFIQDSTGNYGKVKLVLHRNKFWVESPYPDILRMLLKVGLPGC